MLLRKALQRLNDPSDRAAAGRVACVLLLLETLLSVAIIVRVPCTYIYLSFAAISYRSKRWLETQYSVFCRHGN